MSAWPRGCCQGGVLRRSLLCVLALGCHHAEPSTEVDGGGSGDAGAEDAPALIDAALEGKVCNGQPADLANPATGCANVTCDACPLRVGALAATCSATHACDFTCPANTVKTATACATPVPVRTVGIDAGFDHTCAITQSGGVKCWGYNGGGRLGNDSTADAHAPVAVVGITDAVAITAGGGHSCAITVTGNLKCWGLNSAGQLGTGTYVESHVAIDVPGMTKVVSVSAGNIHTCAVTTAGAVKCWGYNVHGELGNNSATQFFNTPVDVVGLDHGAVAVAAGAMHTCAVMATGAVKCWGDNRHGQLGNNSTVASLVPVDVANLTTAIDIAVGGDTSFSRSHSCVLTSGHGVKCWGNHGFGQLGTGGFESGSTVPVDSLQTSGVVAISAGPLGMLAVRSTGLKGWGDGSNGELGSASSTEALAPVDVPGFNAGLAAAAAGRGHACALAAAGGVRCVGYNANGQLGNNSTTTTQTAVDVVGL